MQISIPTLLIRGGTSRGPFFHETDLPADTASRDGVLLAVIGLPDRSQIGTARALMKGEALIHQSVWKGDTA
ncbi:PrpF domain-containing protein [Cupriavidus sp. 8B]